jgi:hypothetical protein
MLSPSHMSVYPPVNYGRFMRNRARATCDIYSLGTGTIHHATSSPVYSCRSFLQALSQSTAQGPVAPTRSDPDWLKVIIYTPSSGAVNFSYMFLGSMLPQPRFVRFRLVAPPTHATFLQDHDKFETLYCQALTSWPNRNASPPWN